MKIFKPLISGIIGSAAGYAAAKSVQRLKATEVREDIKKAHKQALSNALKRKFACDASLSALLKSGCANSSDSDKCVQTQMSLFNLSGYCKDSYEEQLLLINKEFEGLRAKK